MKKILLAIAVISIISCMQPKKAEPIAQPVPVIDTPLTRAKSLSDTIFYYVERVDKKLMSKKQLTKKCDPLQRELDSLIKTLNANQYAELSAYRTQLVSAMVDRKVIRDRN